MNRYAFSLVLIAAMASMSAYAQRAPADPPTEGTAEVEAPMPEVGNPTTLPDSYLRDYGLAPRPDPTVTTTAPTIRQNGVTVPNPNADWNAAQQQYQSGATSGTVTTPTPDPVAPPAAPTPTYKATTQNYDCKYSKPCFGQVEALTTGQTITSSTNSIAFTIPYTAYRSGLPCPGGYIFSIWAGMAFPTGSLWQAGVMFSGTYNSVCQYTTGSITPFYGDYGGGVPDAVQKQFPGISLKPGDKVFVSIWSVVGTTTLKASFTNITTGQSTTIQYNAPHAVSNPKFYWSSESSFPPHFGQVQVFGSATDQSGKVYRPGDITNGSVNYWNMVNTNYPASPNWALIQNVTPGNFTINAQ